MYFLIETSEEGLSISKIKDVDNLLKDATDRDWETNFKMDPKF